MIWLFNGCEKWHKESHVKVIQAKNYFNLKQTRGSIWTMSLPNWWEGP